MRVRISFFIFKMLIILFGSQTTNAYFLEIGDYIKQTESMSSLVHFSFIYIYREGNTAIDLFANMTEHCKIVI